MYSRVFVDEHWNLVASIIGKFAVILIDIDGLLAGELPGIASKVSVAAAIALLLCVNSVRSSGSISPRNKKASVPKDRRR